MNMIEKIAMAIYNSELEEERSCSWEDLFTGEKVQYRRQARLAIEAMREINDNLMEVLENDGYDAMIDAALKE